MWTQSCRFEDLVAVLKTNFYFVKLKTKFKNPYSKTLLHATTTSTSGSIPRKKYVSEIKKAALNVVSIADCSF